MWIGRRPHRSPYRPRVDVPVFAYQYWRRRLYRSRIDVQAAVNARAAFPTKPITWSAIAAVL